MGNIIHVNLHINDKFVFYTDWYAVAIFVDSVQESFF